MLVQGATELALTKLDVLAYMERIPVCVAYDIDGERVTDFPTGARLERAKPVYEMREGFGCSVEEITRCRSFEALPRAARAYIDELEQMVGCPIRYISVGASRDDIIVR